jgi:predicted metal-binding membrane protein
MILQQRSSHAFIGISALLFAASMALTITWCRSMAAMHAMPMPGGWTMSMMWMRMPGQSWPGAATEFLGMWLVMMLAMMLPSLLPMLSRYRAAVTAGGARLDALTGLVAAAYFTIWTLFGVLVFVIGMILAQLEMELPMFARMVPMAIGATVLIAGALQFSAWKRHHLACCRGTACCGALSADARSAWRHGLRLGMHCVHCCFGLTAILLVVGMMDLRAMALVTAAISAERLAPRGERAMTLIGVVLTIAGCIQIARAAFA